MSRLKDRLNKIAGMPTTAPATKYQRYSLTMMVNTRLRQKSTVSQIRIITVQTTFLPG